MNNFIREASSYAEMRGKRIRFIRDHLLNLTREEFCKNSEITAAALKGWELGWGGGLTTQGAEKIVKRARELNVYCTNSWLIHGIGREAVFLTKDLDIQEDDENHIAKELLLFSEIQNSITTIVKDDSMIPTFYPGNYVGGIIVSDIKKAFGKECIIVDNYDNTYVRILDGGDNSNLFNLYCTNQNTSLKKEIKNITIKFAAPIIWFRKIHR